MVPRVVVVAVVLSEVVGVSAEVVVAVSAAASEAGSVEAVAAAGKDQVSMLKLYSWSPICWVAARKQRRCIIGLVRGRSASEHRHNAVCSAHSIPVLYKAERIILHYWAGMEQVSLSCLLVYSLPVLYWPTH